jgi:hypothetical protein
MQIKFNADFELEIVTSIENDIPITEIEVFRAGQETEIDICDDMEPPFASEIQFGDGSVAFVDEDFWKAVSIVDFLAN